MAELVDALDSKSSARKGVRVRPPLRVLTSGIFFGRFPSFFFILIANRQM